MNYTLNWSTEMLHFNVAMIITTLGFLTFYFAEHSNRIYQFFLKKRDKDYAQMQMVFIHHLGGAFFFGIVPLVVYFLILKANPADFGFTSMSGNAWIWILILGCIAIVLAWISSNKENRQAIYPSIRKLKWSKTLVVKSALGWSLYLAAVEIMYRGFILFSCLAAFDIWTAFTINAVFNSLTHIHKGMAEALLSIPTSILFCIMTIETGSVFTVMIVHIILSLSNEWLSLRNHPEIGLETKT